MIDAAQAAAEFGAGNLASATLTLSVEDPSGPLPVLIGSKAATIPAGSGRQSASVTLDGGETGKITLRLHPETACSFKHVKLELGAQATPWRGAAPDIEEYRCRRHYQRLSVTGGAPGMLGHVAQRVTLNLIDAPCALPVVVRARQIMATYADMEELIRLGAYRAGSSTEVDEAIRLHDPLEQFLGQAKEEATDLGQGYQRLEQILGSVETEN